jgi:hypothetical protein
MRRCLWRVVLSGGVAAFELSLLSMPNKGCTQTQKPETTSQILEQHHGGMFC